MMPVYALAAVPSVLPVSQALLHWATMAASSLLSATWEGLVLTAAVALCLRLLPGMSPAARSLVWAVVFAVVILLHFGPGSSPAWLSGQAATHDSGLRLEPLRVDPRWSLAAAALWVLVGLGRGLQLLASAMQLRNVARRATVVYALRDTDAGSTGSKLGRFRRRVLLCTSADVDRPCVLGFLRPRILVPASLFAELSAPELEQVILHEMEHLLRGDDWTNLLQKLALVVFPLNPVLVWVERRLCLERELACDDGVLRSTGAPKAYASCLAKLAEHALLLREASSLALGALERRSELVRRVHRILAFSQPAAMGRRQAAAVTTMLLAGLLGGAVGLGHAPQLVRFGPVGTSGHFMAERQMAASDGLPEMRPAIARDGMGTRPQFVSAVMSGRPQAQSSTSEGQKFPLKGATSSSPVARNRTAVAMPDAAVAKMPMRSRAPRQGLIQQAALRQSVAQQRQWVVLTRWQEPGQVPAMLLSLPQPSRYAYAAVRVPDGWLIVSL